MNLMVLPLWAWILFYVMVLLMLVADLKMFGSQHEVKVGEVEVPTPVSLAVIFGVLVLSMLLSFIVTKHNQT